MHKVQTRGPLKGICNICGLYRKLTEDHIPPKGSIRLKQVEMFSITSVLGMEKPSKGRVSQNGIKYRTICSECNNTKLGTNYDPAFNLFNKSVGELLKSSLILPNKNYIYGEPNKIIRALIGHLLAFGIGGHNLGRIVIKFQEYFMDENAVLPGGIKIYYWPYPYQRQVIIKDGGVLFGPGKFVGFWLLKFFPMSYMVTWEESNDVDIKLPNLTVWSKFELSHKTDIPVFLTDIPHELWPEAPTENGIVLYGERAIGAFPKGENNKKN